MQTRTVVRLAVLIPTVVAALTAPTVTQAQYASYRYQVNVSGPQWTWYANGYNGGQITATVIDNTTRMRAVGVPVRFEIDYGIPFNSSGSTNMYGTATCSVSTIDAGYYSVYAFAGSDGSYAYAPTSPSQVYGSSITITSPTNGYTHNCSQIYKALRVYFNHSNRKMACNPYMTTGWPYRTILYHGSLQSSSIGYTRNYYASQTSASDYVDINPCNIGATSQFVNADHYLLRRTYGGYYRYNSPELYSNQVSFYRVGGTFGG